MRHQLKALSLLFCTSLFALTSGSADAQSDLSGRYIFVQQTVSRTKLPVLKDITTVTRAIVLHRLKHDTSGDSTGATSISGPGKLCSLTSKSDSKLVSTTYPSAFLQALPTPSLQAKLRREGEKLHITSPTQTLVLGAKLKAPTSESLPTEKSDPRVLDQDRDGHPGVSVRIDGFVSGEVYVVQRSRTSWQGAQSGQTFHGAVQAEVEQSIVGASSSMLENGPEPQLNKERSVFWLKRVRDGITCEQAIQLASGWRK